ncbi:heme peroxidase [Mycena galopus ATCC 62051]|nr:heme peroxidase [Mycena galopus ATCC 62051]
MLLYRLIPLACAWQLVVGSAAVYNWPDPLLDNIDDQLHVDRFTTLNVLSRDCATRDRTTVGAQWLRIAFHDFATHNITTGKGGLDASTIFELDRPQVSAPAAFRSPSASGYSIRALPSVADIIAMGAVTSVAGFGGPVIPFRAGRIDGTKAGPETVPEPQQDLDSHIAAFKRLGFNETEMIGLLACGHALGTLEPCRFPLDRDARSPGWCHLSSPLYIQQLNLRVTEYLNSTTINVLEVGSNISTRSDLHIFSSNGNVTMNRLASLDVFNTECTNLIGRMIDTVPSTVTLTDPVEVIVYKVQAMMLFLSNGSHVFLATMRVVYPKNGSAPFIVDNHGANYTINHDVLWFDPRRFSFPEGGSNMVVAV